MVLAYHLVWTAYGWWLPNDPRGSMSRTLRRDVLAELGELHLGRRGAQPAGWVIRDFYGRAAPLLRHPILSFDAAEIACVAEAFAETAAACRYTCYACAVLPDHVHLVIRKHRDSAEQMIANLQGASVRALQSQGARVQDHPVWGGPGWKVFLDTPQAIERTVRYVAANPVQARMGQQTWSFVKPYDGWPFQRVRRRGA